MHIGIPTVMGNERNDLLAINDLFEPLIKIELFLSQKRKLLWGLFPFIRWPFSLDLVFHLLQAKLWVVLEFVVVSALLVNVDFKTSDFSGFFWDVIDFEQLKLSVRPALFISFSPFDPDFPLNFLHQVRLEFLNVFKLGMSKLEKIYSLMRWFCFSLMSNLLIS